MRPSAVTTPLDIRPRPAWSGDSVANREGIANSRRRAREAAGVPPRGAETGTQASPECYETQVKARLRRANTGIAESASSESVPGSGTTSMFQRRTVSGE